jgi:hypothetical protein
MSLTTKIVIEMKRFKTFIEIITLLVLVYIGSILFNTSFKELFFVAVFFIFAREFDKHRSLTNDHQRLLDVHLLDIASLKRKEEDSDIAILNLEERLKSLEQKRH